MTVPFIRAYSELLVRTCHRRGAHAIGGMAAFIPNRRDPEITVAALAKVRDDKVRESNDGFDGTWVAHPDLVPVAADVFDAVLGDRPNQLGRTRADVAVGAADLLDVRSLGTASPAGGPTGPRVTEQGLRTNVSVGIQYLESWLRGVGAVAIANLMEDAATAEISRAQLWQWWRHGTTLDDGRVVTRELLARIVDEEISKLGDDDARFDDARELFSRISLDDHFVEFLTTRAYRLID
jgi:malate synthase